MRSTQFASATCAASKRNHVNRNVEVRVDVIAPMILAALMNGNETADGSDAVDAQASTLFVSITTTRSRNSMPRA